jgi:uncharacterized repeat protein (TIGR04076 family)
MNRREFVGHAGCGLAALWAAADLMGSPPDSQAASASGSQTVAPPARKRYRIDLEIYEARPDSWCHKKGDKFLYPQDWGKICPWLRGSLNDVVRILEFGVTLPWMYENTPYQKVIDPNGVTTEYIRCPDPTANLVVKIIRTLVSAPPKE